MTTLIDVVLPDIGDFADVEIVEMNVGVGAVISAEQPLLVVETDKATVEIPAPTAGVVQELLVALGQRVSKGDLLLRLAPADSAPVPVAPALAAPLTHAAPAKPAPVAVTPVAGVPLAICVPDLGEFKQVPIIEITVAVGADVDVEQPLLVLETDKTTLEIPSPFAGTVQTIHVNVGDRISSGDQVLTLLPSAATVAAATPASTAVTPAVTSATGADPHLRNAPVLPRPADMVAIATGRLPHASPAVRQFARELGVDLTQVSGSGPKSRIVKEDVQNFVKQTLAAPPAAVASAPLATSAAAPTVSAADFAQFGRVELQPLPRIRRISGAHLQRCWSTVPHVTQFDTADITELEAFRTRQPTNEIKLTLLPFLLKAVASALDTMPTLKAALASDGEQLIIKHYCHIGVAVDTPQGLVVPVVRDVNQKGLLQLARELAELSAKARAGKLAPTDMQGGVFSISSLGGIGGTAFTPIVNAPEVAILGVSRATMQPVWDGNQFVPRLQLPLALSYDHRVVDGADGVRFTTLLARLLGDIRQLLL